MYACMFVCIHAICTVIWLLLPTHSEPTPLHAKRNLYLFFVIAVAFVVVLYDVTFEYGNDFIQRAVAAWLLDSHVKCRFAASLVRVWVDMRRAHALLLAVWLRMRFYTVRGAVVSQLLCVNFHLLFLVYFCMFAFLAFLPCKRIVCILFLPLRLPYFA